MNKEEFITYWTNRLKPYADFQFKISNPALIEDDIKRDFNKLIPLSLYSTKESLILLLQTLQGFLINDVNELDFYFSIHEFLIPKIKEFLNSHEIYVLYHKTFNHVLLWYYDHNLLDIQTIIEISKNSPDIFEYFIYDIKEYDEEIYKNLLKFGYQIHEFPEKNFKELRGARINHELIAKVIRNDDIDQFQSIISSTNTNINSNIPFSLFEACIAVNYSCLMPTLIQFATFFGSIKIFKFLLMNDAHIDSDIWEFAVHGNNYDIIHLLESTKIEQKNILENTIRYYRYELFEYFKESRDFQITKKCVNRAILNFNLSVLIDPDVLGAIYDDPNQGDDSGIDDWNPLICCSLKSYPILTEMILSISTANPNIIYLPEQTTPLMISTFNSCLENVKLLCKHPETNINMTLLNKSAFCTSAFVGDVPIFDFFLNFSNENSPSNDKDGNRLNKHLSFGSQMHQNPFLWAIKYDHAEILQFFNSPLISKKHRKGLDLFEYSIIYETLECAKFFVRNESDEVFEKILDYYNQNESRISLEQHQKDEIRLLLNEEQKKRKNEKENKRENEEENQKEIEEKE